MAKFFIDRPVFAVVIAIVILLLGGIAIPGLPVATYPDVVPPVELPQPHGLDRLGLGIEVPWAIQRCLGKNYGFLESTLTTDGARELGPQRPRVRIAFRQFTQGGFCQRPRSHQAGLLCHL